MCHDRFITADLTASIECVTVFSGSIDTLACYNIFTFRAVLMEVVLRIPFRKTYLPWYDLVLLVMFNFPILVAESAVDSASLFS